MSILNLPFRFQLDEKTPVAFPPPEKLLRIYSSDFEPSMRTRTRSHFPTARTQSRYLGQKQSLDKIVIAALFAARHFSIVMVG
jgi:hypothetical protein